MTLPLIESEPLRLDPPFYLASALADNGIEGRAIDARQFSDDAIATALNAALRASIETNLADELNPR